MMNKRIDNFSLLFYYSNSLKNSSENSLKGFSPPQQRLMDKYEIKILFGVIMGTLCLITTFGNICVIYRYRKASMVGNLFIISLAIADLIVGVFVMPIATIYAITEVWTMDLPLCLIWLSADYTASTASILNLFTLSLDRYWSITSPLKYLGKRTKSRALIMITIAWGLSLLWLVPITGWSYFFNKGVRYVPSSTCNTEYDKNIAFKVATAICNFYLPLIAMISINTKIYLVIRRRYHNPIMKYSSVNSNLNNTTTNNLNTNSQMNMRFIKQNLNPFPNSSSQYSSSDGHNQNNNLNSPKSDTNANNMNTSKTQEVINNNTIESRRANNIYCQVKDHSFGRMLMRKNRSLSLDISKLDSGYSAKLLINRKSQQLTCEQHYAVSKGLDSKTDNRNMSALAKFKNFFDCIFLQNKKNNEKSAINKNNNNYNNSKLSNFFNQSVNSNKNCYSSKTLENEKDQFGNQALSKSNRKKSQTLANLVDSQELNSKKGNSNCTKKQPKKNNQESPNHKISPFLNKRNDFSPNEYNLLLNNKNNTSHLNHRNQSIAISYASNVTNSPNATPSLYKNAALTLSTNTSNIISSKKSFDLKQINSISETKLNRKGFMNKQEKAFKQLAAIVIGFTLCFSPYFVVFLIVAICENCVSNMIFTFTVWLGYLNSTINPFLYALSNKSLNKSTKRRTGTIKNLNSETNINPHQNNSNHFINNNTNNSIKTQTFNKNNQENFSTRRKKMSLVNL